MNTRLLLLKPALASLLVAASACGDSKGDTTAETTVNLTSSGGDETTTTGFVPTTGDDTTGVVDPSTTTTGVDPSTTTGSTGPDDTTTGEPVGCQAPADDADEDADGVVNAMDNCRCDANPNQLDFDGNAVGNVCDAPLKFTIADGAPPEVNTLATTAKAGMAIVSCEFGVDLVVVNGDVQVTLDDSGVAKIYAMRVNFADTPEYECDLTLFKVKLRIEKFFTDGPDPFAVGFPFTIADHDAGTVLGMTDTPHAILISGVINVTESGNPDLAPPGENPIEMVPGNFPLALAAVGNQEKQVSLQFDDPDSIIFMQTTMGGIEIELRGLQGTMRMKM